MVSLFFISTRYDIKSFGFSGQDLKDVMKHLEELVVYENYEREEKSGGSQEGLIKACLKQMDENAEAAILSHSVGAYVSTLEPSHLKHLASKVVNDTTHWISRLFRFVEVKIVERNAQCVHAGSQTAPVTSMKRRRRDSSACVAWRCTASSPNIPRTATKPCTHDPRSSTSTSMQNPHWLHTSPLWYIFSFRYHVFCICIDSGFCSLVCQHLALEPCPVRPPKPSRTKWTSLPSTK
jgi:hypothetical protein